jgi:hypothetical protein
VDSSQTVPVEMHGTESDSYARDESSSEQEVGNLLSWDFSWVDINSFQSVRARVCVWCVDLIMVQIYVCSSIFKHMA